MLRGDRARCWAGDNVLLGHGVLNPRLKLGMCGRPLSTSAIARDAIVQKQRNTGYGISEVKALARVIVNTFVSVTAHQPLHPKLGEVAAQLCRRTRPARVSHCSSLPLHPRHTEKRKDDPGPADEIHSCLTRPCALSIVTGGGRDAQPIQMRHVWRLNARRTTFMYGRLQGEYGHVGPRANLTTALLSER
eukprot:6172071-Pleurochrysis_carterae.AAC.1